MTLQGNDDQGDGPLEHVVDDGLQAFAAIGAEARRGDRLVAVDERGHGSPAHDRRSDEGAHARLPIEGEPPAATSGGCRRRRVRRGEVERKVGGAGVRPHPGAEPFNGCLLQGRTRGQPAQEALGAQQGQQLVDVATGHLFDDGVDGAGYRDPFEQRQEPAVPRSGVEPNQKFHDAAKLSIAPEIGLPCRTEGLKFR